jgi:hypothetical protein
MYQTISKQIVRQFKPCCSDPSIYITDENEELPIKDWIQKYRNVVPSKYIVWLLLREEFLSEKDLRLFAVWCAREALKFVENPDERSVEVCNVAERYANGQATKEELLAARDAAYKAAYDAAYAAASATYDATYAAASATYDAYYDAAYYAAHYAATSSASDAAYATANYYAAKAAYYAATDVAYAAQVDKLLTYFD